jgi:flagellar FliL protein
MTGNSLIDKILLGANGAVVLLAAGLVFYSHNNIKPPPTDISGEEKSLLDTAIADSQIKPHAMKQMTVNLYSEGTRLRFLNAEMNLVPFKQDDIETLKSNEHIVKNELITIAATMTPDELGSITGKILLESRLKKAVNQKLNQPLIKSIFFTKFLVQ